MAATITRARWSREQIAELSDVQLFRHSYDEMIEMVLDSGVPIRDPSSLRSMVGDGVEAWAFFGPANSAAPSRDKDCPKWLLQSAVRFGCPSDFSPSAK